MVSGARPWRQYKGRVSRPPQLRMLPGRQVHVKTTSPHLDCVFQHLPRLRSSPNLPTPCRSFFGRALTSLGEIEAPAQNPDLQRPGEDPRAGIGRYVGGYITPTGMGRKNTQYWHIECFPEFPICQPAGGRRSDEQNSRAAVGGAHPHLAKSPSTRFPCRSWSRSMARRCMVGGTKTSPIPYRG
jgi:hypothetical protein